jgi:hypothetical protein
VTTTSTPESDRVAPSPAQSIPAQSILARRAHTDAGVRLGAMATLWMGLLLVTYWWIADRGLQDLSGWATGLTSVGRLSGLVATMLLLAQVVLMARVPSPPST